MNVQAYAGALPQELQVTGVRKGMWQKQVPRPGVDAQVVRGVATLRGWQRMARQVCQGPAVIVQPVFWMGAQGA
jgi:hypothetical protein